MTTNTDSLRPGDLALIEMGAIRVTRTVRRVDADALVVDTRYGVAVLPLDRIASVEAVRSFPRLTCGGDCPAEIVDHAIGDPGCRSDYRSIVSYSLDGAR